MLESNQKSGRWLFWILGSVGLGVVGLIVVLFLVFIAAVLPHGENVFGSDPVVVLKLEGPIYEADELLHDLNQISENQSVKAVVIRVDSPGGAIGPSQELYREVNRVRKSGKVVVASMGTVAASGGYYVASAADQIVANPGTITGSIGVIMQSMGLQDVAQNLKLDPRVIKSGKFKDVGNPFRKVEEHEKVYLQELSDDMYKQFVGDVAVNRKIPMEQMLTLAEGKIYSGKQAKAVKLVDELGNLFDAVALAKQLAKLPANADVQWPRKPKPIEEFLSGEAMSKAFKGALGAFEGRFRILWLSEFDSASF